MSKSACLAAIALMLIPVFCAAAAEEENQVKPADVATPLDSLKGVHPRLYLTEARVGELRRLVKDDPAYALMFERVRAIADRGVKEGPPEYQARGDAEWDEQLWQRPVGEMMPYLAITYLLTGEAQYLDAARTWMLKSLSYPTWGRGIFENRDLAAGHQLYGISLAYDWLYNDLNDETRAAIRDGMVRHAALEHKAAANDEIYWSDDYLQNHLWVSITGIAAAGFAFYGEADDADKWIALPLEKYGISLGLLGDDGASFEGVPYWGYGVEYMMKFLDLARDLLGKDFYKGHPWLSRTADFRIHTSLPRASWTRESTLMSFGDSPKFDWYGPNYLLRKFAREYRNGFAQELADAVDAAPGVNHPVSEWLNLIWHDPSVTPAGPSGLPTLKHFTDQDLVMARSDWSGTESLIGFKCGPHCGYKALNDMTVDPGSGHVHPDAGAFLIFAHGDWLISDDGYTLKTTAFQNTFVINGVGQEGEGRQWFQGQTLMESKRHARILAAVPGADMDYLAGEASGAYPVTAGLKRFTRSIFFLKPSTWVVVDEIEADKPSALDLYFHGDFPFERVSDNAFETRGTRGSLRFITLAPADVSAEAFMQEIKHTSGSILKEKKPALKLTTPAPADRALFISVLSAFPTVGGVPASASIDRADGATRVTVETTGRTWRFRLDAGRKNPAEPVLVLEKGK